MEKTALVIMHVWDVGIEGGPAVDPNYAIGASFRENFTEQEQIMKNVIVPSMVAARQCGMEVTHLTNYTIAMKDRRAAVDMDPVPDDPLTPGADVANPVVAGWSQYIHERAHGPYLRNPPYTEMNRVKWFDPLPGEIFAFQTMQFHRALQKRGIQNLIYTGFAADMCILRAGCGSEPMLALGYRVYLIRDATLGTEYPDWFEHRLATTWGIRYFETHCGDSLESSDFIQACQNIKYR